MSPHFTDEEVKFDFTDEDVHEYIQSLHLMMDLISAGVTCKLYIMLWITSGITQDYDPLRL